MTPFAAERLAQERWDQLLALGAATRQPRRQPLRRLREHYLRWAGHNVPDRGEAFDVVGYGGEQPA